MSSTMEIRRAERKKAKLRIGLFGPSGSGKTMSSLKVASGLAPWDKILLIDTENKSGDLYSHIGPYNVLTLQSPFTPERYVEAMDAAVAAGMEVIIIDSITHEWAGPGGILETADVLSVSAKNAFTIWQKLTPRHNKFIDRILSLPVHVICCGRSKQEYVMNEVEKNGKKVNVPEKIGLKSITREGFDYEMTVAFDLDINHLARSTKDRTGLFQDKPEEILNAESGKKLIEWANSGALDPEVEMITKEQLDQLNDLIKKLEADPGQVNQFILKTWGKGMFELNQKQSVEVLKRFSDRLEAKIKEKAAAAETDATLAEFDAKVDSKQVERTQLDQETAKAAEDLDKALGTTKEETNAAKLMREGQQKAAAGVNQF